jgi:hypothetical protein
MVLPHSSSCLSLFVAPLRLLHSLPVLYHSKGEQLLGSLDGGRRRRRLEAVQKRATQSVYVSVHRATTKSAAREPKCKFIVKFKPKDKGYVFLRSVQLALLSTKL